MRNFKVLFFALLGVSLFFTSCNDGDDPKPAGKYDNGVFINNEGVFSQGNGSVSFYDNAKDSVSNEIFKGENNLPLGDVVQSITRADGKIYIAVNASNKVVVVNQTDFKYVATVDVMQPRYIAVDGDKAYVSTWAGKVYVVNTKSYEVVDSISTGTGSEGLLVSGGKLFVANSGGYGIDSTVTVVSLADYSTTSIDVGAYCPSMIEDDADGNVWVLAKGSVIYDATWSPIGHNPSYLVKLSSDGSSIVKSVMLFDNLHPAKLDRNSAGTKLYYGGAWGFQGLYEFDVDASTASSSPLINEINYGFFVNQTDDVIYLLQEASIANGKMFRYDSKGTKLGEFSVGLYPSGGC